MASGRKWSGGIAIFGKKVKFAADIAARLGFLGVAHGAGEVDRFAAEKAFENLGAACAILVFRQPGVFLADRSGVIVVVVGVGAKNREIGIEQDLSVEIDPVGTVAFCCEDQAAYFVDRFVRRFELAQSLMGVTRAFLLVVTGVWIVDHIMKPGGEEDRLCVFDVKIGRELVNNG